MNSALIKAALVAAESELGESAPFDNILARAREIAGADAFGSLLDEYDAKRAVQGRFAGLSGAELVEACFREEMGQAQEVVKAAAVDPRLEGLTGAALLQAALEAELE